MNSQVETVTAIDTSRELYPNQLINRELIPIMGYLDRIRIMPLLVFAISMNDGILYKRQMGELTINIKSSEGPERKRPTGIYLSQLLQVKTLNLPGRISSNFRFIF